MAKQKEGRNLILKKAQLAKAEKIAGRVAERKAILRKEITEQEGTANWQNGELSRLIKELHLNCTFGEANTLTIGFGSDVEGRTFPKPLNPNAYEVLEKLEDLSILHPEKEGKIYPSTGAVTRENKGKIHHRNFDDGWDVSSSYSVFFDFDKQPENTYDLLLKRLQKLAENYRDKPQTQVV